MPAMSTSRLVLALLPSALLAACGYGWQEEPRVYPPSAANSARGQVVAGTSGLPGDYLVQPGDTLYAIGFKNQIDWKDLAAWNGIAGPDYLIRVGQGLRLSAPLASSGSEVVETRPLQTGALPPPPKPTGPAPVPVPAPVPMPAPVGAPSAVAAVPTPSVLPAPANSPFRWAWPTTGPVLRGYNLAAGAKGIDIGGDIGQPVTAAAAGKVVYSGSALKGYGELVIVKHDDTYLSAYGYNQRRLVKEGDEVRAGQTIAELGVGPEQKPALHFEIREHGKPVEPLRFLPAR
ncbi:MAG: LysM peptidoglycan-binding domain-containing protein [Nevskiaceae bacterium]|nr:MAG: LysM peptidoglycan-binding domain-containing protein [Nevskiaceae bacterium]TAM25133.1 MAG: LysM peptidoglycan-binding domain-containing protein [Nevskiaceae bacterium]